MRIALALEVEVPDGTDPLGISIDHAQISLPDGTGYRFSNLERDGLPFVRQEIHPDPDAVFPDDPLCGCGARHAVHVD